jgi:hypothetical protein
MERRGEVPDVDEGAQRCHTGRHESNPGRRHAVRPLRSSGRLPVSIRFHSQRLSTARQNSSSRNPPPPRSRWRAVNPTTTKGHRASIAWLNCASIAAVARSAWPDSDHFLPYGLVAALLTTSVIPTSRLVERVLAIGTAGFEPATPCSQSGSPGCPWVAVVARLG